MEAVPVLPTVLTAAEKLEACRRIDDKDWAVSLAFVSTRPTPKTLIVYAHEQQKTYPEGNKSAWHYASQGGYRDGFSETILQTVAREVAEEIFPRRRQREPFEANLHAYLSDLLTEGSPLLSCQYGRRTRKQRANGTARLYVWFRLLIVPNVTPPFLKEALVRRREPSITVNADGSREECRHHQWFRKAELDALAARKKALPFDFTAAQCDFERQCWREDILFVRTDL